MATRSRTFSLTQLDLLAEWGRTPPLGLRLNLAGDHEELNEVAEVERDRNLALYLITPDVGDAVGVYFGGSGCRDAFRDAAGGKADGVEGIVVADLREALALVVRAERLGLGMVD